MTHSKESQSERELFKMSSKFLGVIYWDKNIGLGITLRGKMIAV